MVRSAGCTQGITGCHPQGGPAFCLLWCSPVSCVAVMCMSCESHMLACSNQCVGEDDGENEGHRINNNRIQEEAC